MALLLPDTQTPDLLSLTPGSKANITEPPEAWGRLYSTYVRIEGVDLKNDTFKLGRSENCDIVITQDKVPLRLLNSISKLHFTITREDGLIYIKDSSKNGTFLNGKLIGKGNTNILQNDDEISIGLVGLKVYVFKGYYNVDNDKYLPEKLRKKYQVSKLLGKGACGEVRLVFDKQSLKPYAVKKIIKAKSFVGKYHIMNHPDKIQREIEIMQNLDHPCVITMVDIEESEDSFYLILEYMEGGELKELVNTVHPINEQEAKFLFYQMVLALNYLHSHAIIHRDLKPENVLLKKFSADTIVKISDFGLSRFISDDEDELMRTVCGTPLYAAPEILARHSYGPGVDVWSLGVVLYYMLSHQLPFRTKNMNALNNMVMKGEYNFDSRGWSDIGDDAKDLVKRMMTVEPSDRIKLDDILKHPWIADDSVMQDKVNELLYGEHGTYTIVFSSETSYASGESMSPPAKRSRCE